MGRDCVSKAGGALESRQLVSWKNFGESQRSDEKPCPEVHSQAVTAILALRVELLFSHQYQYNKYTSSPYVKKIWSLYNFLISRLSYSILCNTLRPLCRSTDACKCIKLTIDDWWQCFFFHVVVPEAFHHIRSYRISPDHKGKLL